MVQKGFIFGLLAFSLILVVGFSGVAQAQSCPTGNCPLRQAGSRPRLIRVVPQFQPGQPVKNAGRAVVGAVEGAAQVASLPAKAMRETVSFFHHEKPVRRAAGRVLRRLGQGVVNVMTGNGPIARRLRSR